MAIERAIVTNLGSFNIGNAPDTLAANPDVRYLRDGEAAIDANLTFQTSLDASPREILESIVSVVIESQPTGFNLQERDVIVPSIERG